MMARETMYALIRAMLFVCIAVPATLIDLKYMRIPDFFSLGGLACLLLFDLLRMPSSALRDGLAAVIAFCLLSAIRYATKGLGFGDVKYAATGAFFTGLPYWFLAMAVAAIAAMLFFSVAIVVLKKERALMIPFAPFLSVGALAAGAAKFFAAD